MEVDSFLKGGVKLKKVAVIKIPVVKVESQHIDL